MNAEGPGRWCPAMLANVRGFPGLLSEIWMSGGYVNGSWGLGEANLFRKGVGYGRDAGGGWGCWREPGGAPVDRIRRSCGIGMTCFRSKGQSRCADRTGNLPLTECFEFYLHGHRGQVSFECCAVFAKVFYSAIIYKNSVWRISP